jgi:hypothetical protein
MSNIYIRIFLRFLGCLFFQVLVLNNIELSGLMNIYYYPLFILLLPLQMPQWLCLLLSFAMGYCVGIFTNTAGLHAFAAVLIAFIRPLVIQVIFPRTETDDVEEITIEKSGIFNFILFVFVLIFIHHFVLFLVEVWSFTKFYFTVLKIILSAVLSSSVIIIGEYLFWRKRLK